MPLNLPASCGDNAGSGVVVGAHEISVQETTVFCTRRGAGGESRDRGHGGTRVAACAVLAGQTSTNYAGPMAYAHFSEGDVAVYGDVDSGVLVCLACDFIPVAETEYHTKSAAEMIAHLHGHVAAGQRIPPHAFERLQKEAAEIDAWIARSGARSQRGS